MNFTHRFPYRSGFKNVMFGGEGLFVVSLELTKQFVHNDVQKLTPITSLEDDIEWTRYCLVTGYACGQNG